MLNANKEYNFHSHWGILKIQIQYYHVLILTLVILSQEEPPSLSPVAVVPR